MAAVFFGGNWSLILVQQSGMKTEILKITAPDDSQSVQRAAELLDAGALVAFPTETVYGIGCKVDKQTIDRLDAVKNRPSSKRYTLHIGSREQLKKYVPSMNARVRKLVQHAFPGPVTIVFELDDEALRQAERNFPKSVFELLYADGTLGVRYPACPVTCAILAAAQFPVVVPSANPAGLAPAVAAKEVLGYFDGKIECIVEIPDFAADLKQSSTVVKIGKRDIRILREGAMSACQIRDWATIRVLFVCTGNTCRSPMAAGFGRKYFSDNLGCPVDELEHFGYIIDSAGVAACEGVPASRYAVEVCRGQRIDLGGHQSHQLTLGDVEQSDVIFTMSRSHRDSIVQLFPSASEKCFVLDDTSDILDPIGSGIDVYRSCFRQIGNNIMKKKERVL
ncbi:MAG: threonylcarbamoyl-AMP synthase [Planctomycetales bacterium 4572_13]|nr:MAG: threonylcarbamoyl-AMP synthase [Planctomycetales bacterium 4572_13]